MNFLKVLCQAPFCVISPCRSPSRPKCSPATNLALATVAHLSSPDAVTRPARNMAEALAAKKIAHESYAVGPSRSPRQAHETGGKQPHARRPPSLLGTPFALAHVACFLVMLPRPCAPCAAAVRIRCPLLNLAAGDDTEGARLLGVRPTPGPRLYSRRGEVNPPT